MAVPKIIVWAGIIGALIFIVLGLVSDYFFGHWPDVLSLMGMLLLVCFGSSFVVDLVFSDLIARARNFSPELLKDYSSCGFSWLIERVRTWV